MKKWLAFGGLMGLGSLLVYELKLKTKGKVQTLVTLTDKKILEIFVHIKSHYRDAFKKHQKLFRNGRRKLQRNSQEYANYVFDSYSSLPKIFSDCVDEVLSEQHISREIYENSWKLLKSDESIFEAAEEMKTIITTGYPRTDLPIDTIRDALDFCSEKLGPELRSLESLQLAISVLEDDLKDMYGLEIEDFERGYYSLMEGCNEYDAVFSSVREAKSIIDT